MQISSTFQQPSGPRVATFGCWQRAFLRGNECPGFLLEDGVARLCLQGQAPNAWLQSRLPPALSGPSAPIFPKF